MHNNKKFFEIYRKNKLIVFGTFIFDQKIFEKKIFKKKVRKNRENKM